MVNELLDAVVAPGAVAWSTYPAPDASITRSPNSAMPLTGATLNVPDNLPPTGFTLILMVMLLAKAERVGTAPATPGAADRDAAVAREQMVVRAGGRQERRQRESHVREPHAHIDVLLPPAVAEKVTDAPPVRASHDCRRLRTPQESGRRPCPPRLQRRRRDCRPGPRSRPPPPAPPPAPPQAPPPARAPGRGRGGRRGRAPAPP